jgi:hypothetical protein
MGTFVIHFSAVGASEEPISLNQNLEGNLKDPDLDSTFCQSR